MDRAVAAPGRSAQQLPVRNALFDGELVALLSDGTSSFQALQNAQNAGKMAQLVYYVFDVLHFDGYDLTGVELDGRKRSWKTLIPPGDASGPIACQNTSSAAAASFLPKPARKVWKESLASGATGPTLPAAAPIG